MKRSRYVVKAPSHDRKSTIYYNIRNGVGLKVANELASSFSELAEHPALHRVMSKHNFFHNPNEGQEVVDRYLQIQEMLPFHLIVLPHQNCNFRCVYCYEKFDKNKMLPEVEESLKLYVERELRSGRHKVFVASWFGGEPLLAPDVIDRLSEGFARVADEMGVKYKGNITTNGYNLDEKTVDMLLSHKINQLQVTLDGIKECHDHQRILKGGQPTYDRIVENLVRMSKRPEEFSVTIRMNVGPENLQYVEQHIEEMKRLFGNDERFKLYFHNIGHYGGDNDDNISICSENMLVKLTELSLKHDVQAAPIYNKIRPHTTCYAASPNSLIIGTDGMLYKCTVALYDERNHVGQLHQDGTISLNEELMHLWTKSGSEDSKCRECFLSPSCHGDSCPLVRIESGERPCPSQKGMIPEVLTVMDQQNHKFVEVLPMVTDGV